MVSPKLLAAILLSLLFVGTTGTIVGETHQTGNACPSDSPSQGLERSTDASDGTSLERAGPGIATALENVGCPPLEPDQA